MPIFQKLKQVATITDKETGQLVDYSKPYLLLLVDAFSSDYDNGEFVALRGRRETFEYIQSNCIGNNNLTHSYVLTGSLSITDAISLYSTMRNLQEKYHFSEDEDFIDYLNQMAIDTMDEDEKQEHGTVEYLDRLYYSETNQSV